MYLKKKPFPLIYSALLLRDSERVRKQTQQMKLNVTKLKHYLIREHFFPAHVRCICIEQPDRSVLDVR